MRRNLKLVVGLLCLALALWAGMELMSVETKVGDDLSEIERGNDEQVDEQADGARENGNEAALAPKAVEGAKEHAGEREIVPAAGQSYRVSIIDLDEKPVAGLKLALGKEPKWVRVQSDAEGRFEFRTRIDNTKKLDVQVLSPDWVLVDLMDQRLLKSIKLPDDPKMEILLRVHGLLYLSGRVLDAKGIVKAGAEIAFALNRPTWSGTLAQELHFAPRRSGHILGPVQSDSQGRFRITVPVGIKVAGVQARLGTKFKSEVQSLDSWWKDPEIEVELRLLGLGKIQGRVRVTTPKRPESVTLTLSRQMRSTAVIANKPKLTVVKMINVEPGKLFALEGLLPGAYRIDLQAWSSRSSWTKVEPTELQLHAGETKKLDLTIRSKQAGQGGIRGVVMDQTGRRIEDMQVMAFRTGASMTMPSPMPNMPPMPHSFVGKALSDAQGRFQIPARPGTEILLKTTTQARSSGPFVCFDPLERKIVVGREDVRLVVQAKKAGIIQGRILFPRGQDPVPFPAISVMLASPGTPSRSYTVNPKDSSFIMRNLSPGEYKISLTCSTFQPSLQNVIVLAGRPTSILLQLEDLGAFRGRVLDAKGHPIPGVKLWVNIGFAGLTKKHHQNPGATSDKAGWFEIRGFREGGSFLLAFKEGFAPDTRMVKSKQEAQHLTLTLRKEGDLVIRHLPIQGKAFGLKFKTALAYVLNLYLVDPVTRKRQSFKWLSYTPGIPHLRFNKIPAGEYHLLIQVRLPKWKQGAPLPGLWRRVQVKPGETTAADWRKLEK